MTALFLVWQNNYRDRIYPGIKIGDLALGGKTPAEARDLIAARTGQIENKGLSFRYNGRTVTLTTAVASFDSDLSYSALSFSAADMAAAAYGPASERNFWKYLLNYLKPREQKKLSALYNLNQNRLRKFLAESFSDLNISPANAYFSLTADAAGTRLTSNPEKIGKEIKYDEMVATTQANLNNLESGIVTIKTQSKYPEVRQADLAGLAAAAQGIANRGSLILHPPLLAGETATTTAEQAWTVKPEQIITWVRGENRNGRLALGLDQTKIIEYLQTAVAPKLDKEVISPRFEIKNGKVTSWQTGENGYRLNREASAAKINEEFLAGQNDVTLITEEISADGLTAANDFKIKEIIGTGHSRFTGSPVNRRHNIKTGADSLHGLLIKPEEEFSLLKALGQIDASTGYRTELVIKGDKTVPEFGGGLCQIGTTMFRTVLASGLPITERRNHSYRVVYYEPAGTDATIYDPAPDFRFINDTGNYLLIQSRIAGDDLYFDFWGVRDGRTVTTTAPTIYNIVKPEPTKIIETTELAPGAKKCTESSHNGADAYFDYTVVYPESSTTTPLHTRRFNSHYIPWQAVCLVGVATSTVPVGGVTTASSTASSTSAN